MTDVTDQLIDLGNRIVAIKGDHEVEWKLRGYGRLAHARALLEAGDSSWQLELSRTLSGNGDSQKGGLGGCVPWRPLADFTKWLKTHEIEGAAMVRGLWDTGVPWITRLDVADGVLKPVVTGPGTRLALIAVLRGAVEPTSAFPYAEKFFFSLNRILGVKEAALKGSSVERYTAAEEVLTMFRNRALARGQSTPSIFHAHQLAWYAVKYPVPRELGLSERAALATLRGEAFEPGHQSFTDYAAASSVDAEHVPIDADDARSWGWQKILQRRGQGAFRSALLEAYSGKCAVTGCDVEDALEAAHIVPFAETGDQTAENGILLRADIHVLFDVYLLSVDPETLTIVLAPALRSSTYAALHGKQLALPDEASLRPARVGLAKHLKTCGFADQA